MKRHDAIIIGLGAMGAAAAWRLSALGIGVLGLERFEPAHEWGSCSGETRILRQAYFEGQLYAPMVKASLQGWQQLSAESGRHIFQACGVLMLGQADGRLIRGSSQTAEAFGIEHQLLSGSELAQRFPQFRAEKDELALYEPGAGILRVEDALLAFQQRAQAQGAELHFNERVISWEESAHGPIRVFTEKGTYECERLILAPGAWSPSMLAGYQPPLQVERLSQFWFEQADPGASASIQAKDCPILLSQGPESRFLYAIPSLTEEGGMKVAHHRVRTPAAPDLVSRELLPGELEGISADVAAKIPALGARLLRHKVCLYTSTPDEHFILGRHPHHARVLLAAGFSGHGFKFAPLIGETLSELLYYGASKIPLTEFDPQRFHS